MQNPLSESGASWWHITSPYVVDIERDGFRSPAFFASELDDLCWMYVEIGRSFDPVTLYDVRLKLDPKNLLCPQTLFADWLKSWEVLRQATNTRRTDIPDGVTYVSTFGPFDANDDVIRWFESAQFFDTLTALGKSFYTEVVVPLSSEKEYPLSIAETLAGVCVCDWNTLHKMRRYPRYNAWCAQNGIRGWIEVENFYWNEWVLDAAGRWHPRDGGFNIGVFDTKSIEIVEVFPDIHDCYDEEDEKYLSEVIGRKNPMLSFNHDPVWGDYPDTRPYLHNPVTGGTTFYHVTKGEECAFDEPRLSFFGLTKGYVQDFFGIHPTESHHSIHEGYEKERYTICEVRFKNLKWDNIFDIARYIESIDYDMLNYELEDESIDDESIEEMYNEHGRREMHPVQLTSRGEEIQERTGFPVEGYFFEYFRSYRKDKGRQLIADLNSLGYGPFYGFLEDEYVEKQPPCDEDDYDCLSRLSGYNEDSTDSSSPLSLALDFRLGRDIIVELVRYEVVDTRGRKIYGEDLDDPFDDDNKPVEFYPGKER